MVEGDISTGGTDVDVAERGSPGFGELIRIGAVEHEPESSEWFGGHPPSFPAGEGQTVIVLSAPGSSR